MIEFKTYEELDKKKWDFLVRKSGTKMEQLSAYAEIINKEGWKAKYLILEDFKAGIVLYEKKGGINKIKSMPPIGNDEDSLVLLKELKNYMKKHAPFYNYIMPDKYVGILENLKGFYKSLLSTIDIPLDGDLETIYKRIDKKARWGVNKAKKEGLQVIEAGSLGEVEEFYKIYKETCHRGNITPIPLEFMKDFFSKLKEYNFLFLVKYKGEYIAGSWVKIYGKNFSIPKQEYNASLTEYLNMQPNNLLYWHMIEWAKNKGYSYLDLGGTDSEAQKGSKQDNLNQFKERWGGEKKDYYLYTSSLVYYKLLILMKKQGFLSKIINKIK